MAISAPAVDVDICNLALGLLQHRATITSLEQSSSKAARLCALHYASTRNALLRSYQWNFALEWESLAQVSTPEAVWSYAYQLPGWSLRVVEVEGLIADEWEVERDRRLLCDVSKNVTARLVREVTDVAKYDALFVDVLAHSLAVRIGPSLTRHRIVVNNIKDDLRGILALAKKIDAYEKRARADTFVPSYIAVRQI